MPSSASSVKPVAGYDHTNANETRKAYTKIVKRVRGVWGDSTISIPASESDSVSFLSAIVFVDLQGPILTLEKIHESIVVMSRFKLNRTTYEMIRSKKKTTQYNEDRQVLDVFRRNFEAQFGHLDDISSNNDSEEDESVDGDSDGSSFGGFSDQEREISQDEAPKVVKFVDSTRRTGLDMNSRQEKKRFMTNTAPKKASADVVAKPTKPTQEEAEDLKNDIALQRLINESHILAEANKEGHISGADVSTDLDPIGKARIKALEFRLQQAGAKKQHEKMPMNMRKGIIAKQKDRKEKHEAYAKEAGIVLARPSTNGVSKKPARRDRGLQIASVGKNTRHGLVISKSEIARYTSKRRK
jgi:hypothetical protein